MPVILDLLTVLLEYLDLEFDGFVQSAAFQASLLFIYLAYSMGTRMIQFYNNLKIHKLNYAEGPLATSASGLSYVKMTA